MLIVFMVACIPFQRPVTLAATLTSFNGTDIYNGLRGKNFDESWKLYKGDAGGGYLDGGIGWYRKTFTVPSDYEGKKVFVGFDGAYRNNQVWINRN